MRRMVVDTSALLSVLFGEEDGDTILETLLTTELVMSAATRVEAAHAVHRRLGPAAVAELDGLLTDLGISVVAFDDQQACAAIAGPMAFGKGRHAPPASLNLGDAFSCALAKSLNLPLIYKGRDFDCTDLPAGSGATGG